MQLTLTTVLWDITPVIAWETAAQLAQEFLVAKEQSQDLNPIDLTLMHVFIISMLCYGWCSLVAKLYDENRFSSW